ncbi:amidase [Amycolatopsis rhabdoformis]|uniref:Amidase n=1 Tax=Amycolatopsis rhabdoformis TaxID=1448059 RepID=A0ABZ1I8R1_9PSEU|nr:amidase [Amycolatopsis rhabdoformis]WSE29929.1 amidase [Amycolatopsis rhabdoformis]
MVNTWLSDPPADGSIALPRDISAAATALRAGAVTSRELTRTALAAADAVDGELGSYLCRLDEFALAAADRADAELAAGRDRGPLHGIPLAVKDTISTAAAPTTAQSTVLDPAWGAGRDAPVVARLLAAGAVLTGKTTTMEFACGMPESGGPFPVPRNPWDLGAWPGGSSSGSAAGVAAGLFLAALGSDTIGSVRIPAAMCGVTGLMPTFGRVPKSGCVPLAFSVDRVGPVARSAADCALVLEAIAGQAPEDPDSVDAPFAALDVGDLAGLRVGVVRREALPEGADPSVAPAFDAAVAELSRLGLDCVEVELPRYAEMTAADIVTVLCEALAYHRPDLGGRWPQYTRGTRGLLLRAAMLSGADYVQAQRVRRAGQLDLERLFTRVDVVVMPTLSITAPALEGFLTGERDVFELFGHFHTVYWNAAGGPALALPMGVSAGGLPLSVQLAGRPFSDETLLRIGAAFQDRTEHHLRRPALAAEERTRP